MLPSRAEHITPSHSPQCPLMLLQCSDAPQPRAKPNLELLPLFPHISALLQGRSSSVAAPLFLVPAVKHRVGKAGTHLPQ